MKPAAQHLRFIEKFPPKRDMTFTFFDDGRLTIENNETGEMIKPSELKHESKDFYVQQRIKFIKNKLQLAQYKYANANHA